MAKPTTAYVAGLMYDSLSEARLSAIALFNSRWKFMVSTTYNQQVEESHL